MSVYIVFAIFVGCLLGFLFYARYRLQKLDEMEAKLKADEAIED